MKFFCLEEYKMPIQECHSRWDSFSVLLIGRVEDFISSCHVTQFCSEIYIRQKKDKTHFNDFHDFLLMLIIVAVLLLLLLTARREHVQALRSDIGGQPGESTEPLFGGDSIVRYRAHPLIHDVNLLVTAIRNVRVIHHTHAFVHYGVVGRFLVELLHLLKG